MKKWIFLCGAVLSISAGCNKTPAETASPASGTSAATGNLRPDLKNTPAKAYANSGFSPEVQAKMAKMAAETQAKSGGK